MHTEKLKEQRKLDFFESTHLWPDPDLSPQVPPRSILIDYLNQTDKLDPDLIDQIEESLDTQRILDTCRVELGIHPLQELFEEVKIPKDNLSDSDLAQVKLITSQQTLSITTSPINTLSENALPWEIWTTNSEIKIFNGKELRKRWTFSPQTVLLLKGPMDMPNKDKLYRAIAVSDTNEWPKGLMAEDDLLITLDDNSYVLHLWLNYPVSQTQLDQHVTTITPDQRPLIIDLLQKSDDEDDELVNHPQTGLPLDPEFDDDVLLAREQLLERSSYLSSNANALREQFEATSTSENGLTDDPIENQGNESNPSPLIYPFPIVPAMAAASDNTPSYRELHSIEFIHDESGVIIELSENRDPQKLSFCLTEGDESILEGAEIFSSLTSLEPLAKILNGVADFDRQLNNELWIKKADGEIMKFRILDDEE